MTPADILNAMGNGGFALILFVMIYLLWRELVRSRLQCEGQMSDLRDQQMRNVSKIARLEAQTELLIATRNDYRTQPDDPPQPLALRQPMQK